MWIILWFLNFFCRINYLYKRRCYSFFSSKLESVEKTPKKTKNLFKRISTTSSLIVHFLKQTLMAVVNNISRYTYLNVTYIIKSDIFPLITLQLSIHCGPRIPDQLAGITHPRKETQIFFPLILGDPKVFPGHKRHIVFIACFGSALWFPSPYGPWLVNLRMETPRRLHKQMSESSHWFPFITGGRVFRFRQRWVHHSGKHHHGTETTLRWHTTWK